MNLTKPELARMMIERFLVAGHRIGWVAGDEVYGGNPNYGRLLRNAARATSSRWAARAK